MAAIGEIRKRSGLVIILIGVAIIAFVLSDLFRSNRSLFREDQSNAVGKVNEEKITYNQFNQKVQQVKEKFKRQRRIQEISPRMMATVQNQAWDQLIFDRIFKKEQEKLGLRVSDKELFNLVQGDNPHPSVKRAFRDPKTGEFKKERLQQLQRQLKQGPGGQANKQQIERFKQQKQQWINFERNLLRQREREKYFGLIRKSFYVTNLEAERQYLDENRVASIGYVNLAKKSVPDSAVNLTSQSLKQYYDDHKDDYKTDASRTFEYVVFDVTPTSRDSAKIFQNLHDLKKTFKERDKDSSFVELQSDEPFDSTFLSPAEIPAPIQDSVINGDTGDVFGPYLGEKGYEVAKTIDTKADTVEYYKARHILFKPKGSSEADTAEAQSEASEIFNKIQEGASFEKMAMEHSDDPSAKNGGSLGWFSENKMVDPFIKGVKRHDKGDVFLVNSKFGTHIVEVTAEPVSKRYQVGRIIRKIYPSEDTYEKVYKKASEFRSKINSPDEFEKVVRKAGLNKQIAEKIEPSKRLIPGLSDAPELVRWAYSNDEGSLSGIIEVSDQYVIAKLKDVNKKGVQPFEDVKNEIRAEVLKQKKADQLMEKFKKANQSAKKLEEIANNLNKRVKKASSLKFTASTVPGLGNEKPVIGRTFGLKKNMVSEPFKGNNGVYQIKLNKLKGVNPPEKLVSTKEKLRNNISGQAQRQIVQALKDAADIKDMRYKFD